MVVSIYIFYSHYGCDRPKPIDNDFLIRNDRVDFHSIIHPITNN